MSRTVRITIVFALASGMLVVPGALLLQTLVTWPVAFKLALWADLAFYTILLTLWSRIAAIEVFFPLALLLGVALWPQTGTGFFVLTLGILSWIRSGICYRGRPVRALIAEIGCTGGAGMLLVLIGGSSLVAWALKICLFFLVQSLYFFVMSGLRAPSGEKLSVDPFERAMEGAASVLAEE